MIADLKPYPEYKDSGVEWLGQVPEHWAVRKLRSILSNIADRNRPDLPLLSVVREKGVIVRDVSNQQENHNFIPDDLTNYKVVREGQFAMNKMKAWQGSYGVSQHDGIVSPAYFVFNLGDVGGAFFNTAIRSKAYVPFFTQASDGVRIGQWDLSQARMREITFLTPPLPEQAAIVRYLDHVDRQVRQLVRAKQKLIKLLEEQKQAIIHQAVTGQIDVRTGKPYPTYKDSGVEWIAQVPAHWVTKRLKAIARIRYGLGQPPRESSDGLPLIRATNIERGRIVLKNLVYVDPLDVPDSRNAFLSEGEIVVVRSGAYTADSAIITRQYDGAVTGYDMVVTVNKALPQFIAQTLLCNYVRDDQLVIASMRSAQPHLNAEELGSARILLPSSSEQSYIVRFLEQSTADIDTAIGRANREIELLQEYRTRLIADVVTGKLDVQQAAADLPEETEEPEPLDVEDELMGDMDEAFDMDDEI